MTTLPHVSQSASADLLRFACRHCGTSLEVPGSLAGVSGPCPVCTAEITAPPYAAAASGAAQLFAKPPPRRDLPPPLAPVAESRPAVAAVRPVPIIEELPAVNAVATPSVPRVLPAARNGAIPPPHGKRQENAPLYPTRERGIFQESATGSDHELHQERRPVTFRRRGWKRWLDITLVGVFCGLSLACLAALRFTEPLTPAPPPGLPDNLTQRVEEETRLERMRCHEAEELALASVSRYLGAASEQAAASHLLPPPEGVSPPPFPPFATPPPAAWEVKSSRRIAGTDRYLVVVQPQGRPGPVFIVEQTENGPRLHSGPITQQSAGLFQKFTASPGDGEATLYVEARPVLLNVESDYRRDRPDLAGYQFIDVLPAFPGPDNKAMILCMKPGSEAAQHFARRRAHDPDWRPALVQVRWLRHRDAGPYAELVKFIPGPWSGDPPAPPAVTTASTSP